MPRLLRMLLCLSMVVPLSGCCKKGSGGKNAAMVKCRSTATDNPTCKACCTKAGGTSGFFSKSMGCECSF